MTPPLILLDPGHTTTDPGALFGNAREHEIAVRICERLALKLRERGISVLVLPQGLNYHQVQVEALRIVREREVESAAFIAVHVNSANPPGDYGIVGYSWASDHGAALSEDITSALSLAVRECRWKRHGLPSAGWERAWNTIKAVSESPLPVCGVLVEVAFINNPDHAPLYTDSGVERVAIALAAGVVRWGE